MRSQEETSHSRVLEGVSPERREHMRTRFRTLAGHTGGLGTERWAELRVFPVLKTHRDIS